MSQALQHLAKLLEEDIRAEQDKLGTGAAIDWPDYKRRVGRVEGLTKSLSRITETQEQLRKRGELDDDE